MTDTVLNWVAACWLVMAMIAVTVGFGVMVAVNPALAGQVALAVGVVVGVYVTIWSFVRLAK